MVSAEPDSETTWKSAGAVDGSREKQTFLPLPASQTKGMRSYGLSAWILTKPRSTVSLWTGCLSVAPFPHLQDGGNSCTDYLQSCED